MATRMGPRWRGRLVGRCPTKRSHGKEIEHVCRRGGGAKLWTNPLRRRSRRGPSGTRISIACVRGRYGFPSNLYEARRYSSARNDRIRRIGPGGGEGACGALTIQVKTERGTQAAPTTLHRSSCVRVLRRGSIERLPTMNRECPRWLSIRTLRRPAPSSTYLQQLCGYGAVVQVQTERFETIKIENRTPSKFESDVYSRFPTQLRSVKTSHCYPTIAMLLPRRGVLLASQPQCLRSNTIVVRHSINHQRHFFSSSQIPTAQLFFTVGGGTLEDSQIFPNQSNSLQQMKRIVNKSTTLGLGLR